MKGLRAMNILIKDGMIVDGTGKERFQGDIGIKEDKIEAIGIIEESNYQLVINADEHIVCPGFIDTHSHSDLMLLLEPFIQPKIRQGITLELLGQDGISMAPLPKPYINSWRKNIAAIDGDSDDINWKYETTMGYLNMLDRARISQNAAYLVPHGNIRMEAMGLNNRQPTAEELQVMKNITRREMEAGAFGMSTGLVYIPCAYSDKEEITELCRIVNEYDGVFVIHQRNEADEIIDSMKEAIDIARLSGVKLHFSHFKVCGPRNWNKIHEMLELLDKAKDEGIRISFDIYPYTAGSTMLSLLLPPWVHDGGTDMLLDRLKKQVFREKIKYDMLNGIKGWESSYYESGPERIYISSLKGKKNLDLIGKSLMEIGRVQNKNPLDVIFDLLIEESNAVGMVIFSGKEENMLQLLKRPEQNVCTDGILVGKPHPRLYGTFPRVLGKYVREEKVISLEEAIRKMTSQPAEVFGFYKRGVLREGNYADIVIFDPNKIIDKATYSLPNQYSEGVKTVIVNGNIVFNEDTCYSIPAGSVIRKV